MPERGVIEGDSLWMVPDFGPEQGMRGPEIGIEWQGCTLRRLVDLFT